MVSQQILFLFYALVLNQVSWLCMYKKSYVGTGTIFRGRIDFSRPGPLPARAAFPLDVVFSENFSQSLRNLSFLYSHN